MTGGIQNSEIFIPTRPTCQLCSVQILALYFSTSKTNPLTFKRTSDTLISVAVRQMGRKFRKKLPSLGQRVLYVVVKFYIRSSQTGYVTSKNEL